MSEKRILRDRAVVFEKPTNVQSARCVSFKNKPNGKENCFLNANIKRDDNIKDKLLGEAQTYENQYNHRSKKRAAKQNSARKVKLCPMKERNSFNRTLDNIEFIKNKDPVALNVHNLKQNASSKNSFKSKQTKITEYKKNPILSNVENTVTKKVLNTKKKRTETALNLGKVPIWKKDFQVSSSPGRRKLRHIDVYDISFDEELASDKGHFKSQKISSKKNKKKEKRQNLYSNSALKSKKKKLLNSNPIGTKSVFEMNNALDSTVKLRPAENNKMAIFETVAHSDQNAYDNEIHVEQNNAQNSFSISSLNDTTETIQCGLTDFQFSKPKNKMYFSSLSDKSFSVPKMTSTPDAVHSKTGVQIQKNKDVSITDISYTPANIENSIVINSDQNEHDNEVSMEQNDEQNMLSISSLNDTTVQCTLANLQFSELKEKNKMYLSNLADEFEKSFSFSKMTSLPAGNHSKVHTTQNNKVISVTAKIPSSSKDYLSPMVTTNVVSDNDVSPQTDKEVEEITLFDSPEKPKTNKQNDTNATSPAKTIQINLFGEVLRTPSSLESSEDSSVVMPKKAYHTPDNFKINLIRTNKLAARTKKPKKVRLFSLHCFV